MDCRANATNLHMKTIRNPIHWKLPCGLLLLSALTNPPALGEEKGPAKSPAQPVGGNAAASFTEAFTKGKFNFIALLRYEYADQRNLQEAQLLSIRPRFGFTTAAYYGLQGMIEAENITAITDDDLYNAAGSNGQPGRTVIADPETTELNQAWLSYSNCDSVLKAGRQRIVFDNSRWVGDVIWRQNQQTYDSVRLDNASIPDLSLSYSYVWHVNRIFGDVSGLPLGNQDYDSDSHLFHAEYAGLKGMKLVGYVYLMDFDHPAAAIQNNSNATYGGYIQGAWTWDKERNGKLNYRGEFAWQTDYGNSALDYSAPFVAAELTADYGRFTLGAGYELLESDKNTSLRMPFSTLHAFDGWADVFLTAPAPADGLQDLYAVAAVRLPYEVPLRVLFHQFYSAKGGADYGQELDAVVSRKFGKHFTALVKYAHYEGGDAVQFAAPPAARTPAFDKDVFWAQVEFNF